MERLQQSSRIWYGVPVDVTVTSKHWYRVGMLGVTLPHLGLVNLFARWGQPEDERLELIWRHEFGHFQTIPVPLAHLLLILWARRGRTGRPTWLRMLLELVAHQAVWELAAEGYVVAHTKHEHSPTPSAAARRLLATLWGSMAILASRDCLPDARSVVITYHIVFVAWPSVGGSTLPAWLPTDTRSRLPNTGVLFTESLRRLGRSFTQTPYAVRIGIEMSPQPSAGPRVRLHWNLGSPETPRTWLFTSESKRRSTNDSNSHRLCVSNSTGPAL